MPTNRHAPCPSGACQQAVTECARWVAEVQTTLAIDNDRSPEQLRLALNRYLDEPVDNTQDRTLTTFPLDPVIESLLELKALGQDLKDDRQLSPFYLLQALNNQGVFLMPQFEFASDQFGTPIIWLRLQSSHLDEGL